MSCVFIFATLSVLIFFAVYNSITHLTRNEDDDDECDVN